MGAGTRRNLLVVADDFGIGPQTSAGILELAHKGVVTGSVLLTNSPYAATDVGRWQSAGRPMELGWHPNLTLDAPILPPHQVPSLVNPEGSFWNLAAFMKRLSLGRIHAAEIAAELEAQLRRFQELVGQPPRLVNSHHHVGIFSPVGEVLLEVLGRQKLLPYVRRVREPWGLIARIMGARAKRAFLNWHGRRMSLRQEALGFPGNDWLAGITNPPCVKRTRFFEEWLEALPGTTVELSCHPGYLDETLLGRDCERGDGMMQRRVDELHLLRRPEFFQAVARAGFQMAGPSWFVDTNDVHAA